MIRTLLAFAALSLASPALAHSKSEKTVPADGSTVKAVETIRIGFDKPMRVTVIKLMRDGSEQEIERGQGMEPVTEFTATPGTALEAGTYDVEWRGLSDDGHPMNGTFRFTVAE